MNQKSSTPPGQAQRPALDLDENALTRRQFLTYVLGGTGAFMGTLIAAPLVVSAFDPVHRSAGEQFFKTNLRPSDFNDKLPTHVKFTQHIDDGWNSHDVPNDVYVIKYQNKLMIMSHSCTHLGCHVNGSEEGGKSVPPKYNNGQDWFQCPCHNSMYNIYGVPTPTSPAPRPLDLYYYRIESDGTISIGNSFQRTRENWYYNPNPEV